MRVDRWCFTYLHCVITLFNYQIYITGGSPKQLPVFEKAGDDVLKNVTLFRSIADYQRLNEVTQEGKHITIIGGGFLGSELACALGHKCKQEVFS